MNCFGESNWEQSLIYANTLDEGECGLSDRSFEGDWRLPNANELQSLIDLNYSSPAITHPHPFINYDPLIGNFDFWTSTTDMFLAKNRVFIVDLEDGTLANARYKTYFNRTLPVMGGQ